MTLSRMQPLHGAPTQSLLQSIDQLSKTFGVRHLFTDGQTHLTGGKGFRNEHMDSRGFDAEVDIEVAI